MLSLSPSFPRSHLLLVWLFLASSLSAEISGADHDLDDGCERDGAERKDDNNNLDSSLSSPNTNLLLCALREAVMREAHSKQLLEEEKAKKERCQLEKEKYATKAEVCLDGWMDG